MDDWERQKWERERREREQERRERHKERMRAIEEQNELLRELEKQEERREREEEDRRREEERRREKEEKARQDQADYAAACPKCEFCGGYINYYNNSACYEYCCKKCAIDALGRNKLDAYMDHVGHENLSKKLDKLIAKKYEFDAVLLAEGMTSFSVEQYLSLAQLYWYNWPVFGRHPEKSVECLDKVYKNLNPAQKGKMIVSLYKDRKADRKYGDYGNDFGSFFLNELLVSGENIDDFMSLEAQLFLGEMFLSQSGSGGSHLDDDAKFQFAVSAFQKNFYAAETFEEQKEMALKLMDPNQYKDGHKIGLPFLSAILDSVDCRNFVKEMILKLMDPEQFKDGYKLGKSFLSAFLNTSANKHEQLKLIKEIALKLMDPNQCKDGYKIGIPFLSTVLNEFGTQDKQFINEIRYLFASLSFEKVREYLKMSKKYKLIESLLEEELKFQNASAEKFRKESFVPNWIIITVITFILEPVVYWIILFVDAFSSVITRSNYNNAKVFTSSSVSTMAIIAIFLGLFGSNYIIGSLKTSWEAFWKGKAIALDKGDMDMMKFVSKERMQRANAIKREIEKGA